MRNWRKDDAIIFTYPDGGKTYRFTLATIRGDGYLDFLTDPERGAMGGAIRGGLTLSREQAETVWEANRTAERVLADRLFDDNLRGAMSLLLSKGPPYAV